VQLEGDIIEKNSAASFFFRRRKPRMRAAIFMDRILNAYETAWPK
jgi:hypothetical protein